MARKNTPESAGSQYATDQIASEHFAAWVRDQMFEASQTDPSEQLPLETKADARVIARNMLKQLEWDTKRELRGQELTNLIGSGARPGDSEPRPSDVAGFYDGFRKACDNSRDWLADELLTIKGEMGTEECRSTVRASDPTRPPVADRLLAAGAKTYTMMQGAAAKVRTGYAQSQAFFFAMTSRREDAHVADVDIDKGKMDRVARQIGGIVRVGYVVDGVAYVMPSPTKRPATAEETHRPKAVGSARPRR